MNTHYDLLLKKMVKHAHSAEDITEGEAVFNLIVTERGTAKADVLSTLTSTTTGREYTLPKTDGLGLSSQLLPTDNYYLTLYLTAGYSIIGFTISDTDSTNDEVYDPEIKKNTVSGIDLLDFTTSTVSVDVDISELPQLNSIVINDGDTYACNETLEVTFDIVGNVSEYMLSENPDFLGATWQSIPLSFTVNYTKIFVSDILFTLYAKVKNVLGESEVQSDSITLTQPFARTDSPTKYNSIELATNAIIADYPSGLTQDVTISCVGDFTQMRTESPYQCEIINFNKNTQYTLTIDGQNNLLFNCYSLGGFYIFNSDNIIIKNINFINVASELTNSVPEELGAVMIQGNSTSNSDNIVLHSLTIDCKHTTTKSNYGDYGIIAYWLRNLSVINCVFHNQKAAAIKGANINAFNFSKNHFGGYMVTRTISQPALVWINNFDYGYIGDCVFNGNEANAVSINFDTGAILNGRKITIERCSFTNIGSDALRLVSTTPGDYIHIYSNLFYNNLINPRYSYSKQHIDINSTFSSVILKHNTVILTGIRKSESNESFVRSYGGSLGTLEIHNNIVDFRYTNFVNNSASGYFLNVDNLNNLVSSYNYFRDNLQPDVLGKPTGRIRNYIMTSTSANPQFRFMNSLSSGFAEGSLYPYDTGSAFFLLSDDILTPDFRPTLWSSTRLFTDSVFLHYADLDYKSVIGTASAGAYFYAGQAIDETITSITYQYQDLSTNILQEEGSAPFIAYSETPILLYISNPNRLQIYKTTITTELSTIILYGKVLYKKLYSKLLQNGNYEADLLHTVSYESVNRFNINVKQRLPVANFVSLNYFPTAGETVSLINTSIESDSNTWLLRGGKETQTTVNATIGITDNTEGEQKLTISNNVATDEKTTSLYITEYPQRTYAIPSVDKEVVRIGEAATFTPSYSLELATTTYSWVLFDENNTQIATSNTKVFEYIPTTTGRFDIELTTSVNGKTTVNRQNKLLTVTPLLANIEDATIINIPVSTNYSLYQYEGAAVPAGTTLVLSLSNYSVTNEYRLRLKNLTGTEEQPIIVTFNNPEKVIWNFSSYYGFALENCKHLVIDGRGYYNLDYSVCMTKLPTQNNAEIGMRLGDVGSTNIQVFGIEVSSSTFAGMNCKTDPNKDLPQYWRGTFYQRGISCHHNYIHDTKGEGIYFGYFNVDVLTAVNSQGVTVTYRAHELVDCKIYRNIFKRTGWDSIQLNNATGNSEICYNDIEDAAYLPEQDQASFMSVSINGKIYNNRMIRCGGLGIQFGAQGPNLDIFNNIIADTAYGNPALLILSSKNCPEQKADDGETLINTRVTYRIYNNTVVTNGDFLRAKSLVDYPNTYTKNNLYKALFLKYFGPTSATLAIWNTNSEGDIIIDETNPYQKIADVVNYDFNIAPDSSLGQTGVLYESLWDFRGFYNWFTLSKFSGAFASIRKQETIAFTLTNVLINNQVNPNTDTTSINVYTSYTGTPTEMLISENIDFSGAIWVNYQQAYPFTISSGDGLKTVYVKIRNVDLVESIALSAQCTLVTSKTLFVDLGRVSTSYSTTGHWNNFGATPTGTVITIGTTLPLIYSDGSSSSIIITLDASGSQCIVGDQGKNDTVNQNLYPSTAVRDNLYIADPNFSVLQISGLDNNKQYDITCLGSRAFVDNRTLFTVQSQSIPLLTRDNLNNVVKFSNLTPSNNIIDVRWENDPASTFSNKYGYFNVLEITEKA